jgi:hypothetical protein
LTIFKGNLSKVFGWIYCSIFTSVTDSDSSEPNIVFL